MRIAKFLLPLGGGLIIIILSLYGFSLLSNRARLPDSINLKEIARIDDFDIKLSKDVNFALALKVPGDTVRVTLARPDAGPEQVDVQLVRFYAGRSYPVAYLIVGLFSFALGMLVYFLGPRDSRSRIFYWLTLFFGSSVIISSGQSCLSTSWLSVLPAILFLFSYPLVFSLFLHFSLTFARNRITSEKIPVYFSGLIFVFFLEFNFLYWVLNQSIEHFRFYVSHFYLFRIYTIVMILLSIYVLITSYRRSQLAEEKVRLAWIFYGVFLGVIPFLAFYQVPEILNIRPLFSEESSAIFFIFIPLALAIAILKHRLFDIHLIINRSLVYTTLSILIISIYFFIVQSVQFLFSRLIPIQKTVISISGVLVAAAVFHPVREKIQHLVDKTFFRMSYNYKKIILEFSRRTGETLTGEELTSLLLETVRNSLSVRKVNVSIIPLNDSPGFSWIRGIQRGDPIADVIPLLANEPPVPRLLADKKLIQSESGIDFSQERTLAASGWALVFILPLRPGDLIGLLALGPKKSGNRFTVEDLEFLQTLAEALILNIDRIKLQGEVIYERTSKEKLDELNRLKTEFISTVSHEIRTPLSSLQGLAEILQSGKVRDAKKKGEMLALIEEESRRLSHLLHNILDFGRIEQKTRSYCLKSIYLQPVLEEVARAFSFRLRADGFRLELKQPDKPVMVRADAGALKQALINLIDNAIKYSKDRKEINIILKEEKAEIQIQVRDFGLGIPAEEMEKIFESFYRIPGASKLNPEGVGLGLNIVKHIMEGHGGRTEVESQVGSGTTFSLILPAHET